MSAQGPAQVGAAENQLSGALGRLIALSEAYPDLKANANFQQLQSELSDIENKIAASRRFFNNAVQEYNTGIQQFPAALFAGMLSVYPARISFDLGATRTEVEAGADGEVLSVIVSSPARHCGRRVAHARPMINSAKQSNSLNKAGLLRRSAPGMTISSGTAHHGRLRSLHAYRIEQVSFDAAARRAVPADLRAGLCRRATIAEVVINSDGSVDYYLAAAARDLVAAFPMRPSPPRCGS